MRWSRASSRSPSLALLALFFVSGAASLGCQTVWGKMLGIGLGHEMPAVLAVVTAFMGGMSLGAWLLHGPIARSKSPVRFYVALESALGLWGLALAWLLPWINEHVGVWIGLEPSPFRHGLVAFLVPFVALLPATAAMGATFPAMESWLTRSWPQCVGAVYGANTLGAAFGACLAVFAIAPALGFRHTLWVLAAVNLLCAAIAWMVGRIGVRGQGAGVRGQGAGVGEVAGGLGSRAEGRGRSLGAGLMGKLSVTGLLGIGYEVVGIRVLSQVLEDTIYTFAVVLAVYLTGTALGAALYQRWLRHRSEIFRWCVGGLALAVAVEIWVMAGTLRLYQGLRAFLPDSVAGVAVAEMMVALAVFAVPTVGMGIVFSYLVQAAQTSTGAVGRAVALNTAGGALASVLFGVLLLPSLGASWTLVLIVVAYGTLISWQRKLRWMPAAALIIALFAPRPLRLLDVPSGNRVLKWREGALASVAVLEDAGSNRVLRVNNRFQMGGTAAASAEYRQAHLPLLLHPHPQHALFLGLGTGITLGGAVLHPGLSCDGVELLPEVVECFDAFAPFNGGVGRSGGPRIIVADARRYLKSCSSKYDVVVADLFHPARDGAGNLYAREHYQAIRAALTEGGLFCQWLPIHQMSESTLRTVTSTFLEVFPEAQAWLLRFNVDTPVIGLISGVNPFTADWIERRLQAKPLAEELRRLALADSVRFFGCWLAGPKALAAFAASAPDHTDDHPRVTFGAPAFTYRRQVREYEVLMRLIGLPDDELGQQFPTASPEVLEKQMAYLRARDVYLKGLVSEIEGRTDEALAAFVESARLSVEFTSGYARCLTVLSALIQSRPQQARRLLEELMAARPENPVAAQLHKKWFGE